MTHIMWRALELVADKGPIRCSHLGDLLWPKGRRAAGCSCPYARPAGAVAARLAKLGLIERSFTRRPDGEWDMQDWKITEAGLTALESPKGGV